MTPPHGWEGRREIRTAPELAGHRHVRTTVVFTDIGNREWKLGRPPDARLLAQVALYALATAVAREPC